MTTQAKSWFGTKVYIGGVPAIGIHSLHWMEAVRYEFQSSGVTAIRCRLPSEIRPWGLGYRLTVWSHHLSTAAVQVYDATDQLLVTVNANEHARIFLVGKSVAWGDWRAVKNSNTPRLVRT